MTLLAIRDGALIDGTGRDRIPAAAVLIDGSQIVAAGPAAALLPGGIEYTEIDAPGSTILPGFIDSHVHIMSEGYDLEKTLLTPFSYNFYKAIVYFRRTIEAGITSIRDA